MRSHSTDSGAIAMLRWMVGTSCSASQRRGGRYLVSRNINKGLSRFCALQRMHAAARLVQ